MTQLYFSSGRNYERNDCHSDFFFPLKIATTTSSRTGAWSGTLLSWTPKPISSMLSVFISCSTKRWKWVYDGTAFLVLKLIALYQWELTPFETDFLVLGCRSSSLQNGFLVTASLPPLGWGSEYCRRQNYIAIVIKQLKQICPFFELLKPGNPLAKLLQTIIDQK